MSRSERTFAFNPSAFLSELIRRDRREKAKKCLTPRQREVHEALLGGPLYRVRGASGFQRADTRRFREQVVRGVVDRGLAVFDQNLGEQGGVVLQGETRT